MYAEQMLKCTSCNQLNSESEFYDYRHEHKCKSCMSEARKVEYKRDSITKIARVRKYSRENPDKIRNTKLKQTYGLTKDEYNRKLAEQDGKCAICNRPESVFRQGKLMALAVDHNHDTGANRDLLCVKCNRALGLLEENPTFMQSMIEYTKKHLK